MKKEREITPTEAGENAARREGYEEENIMIDISKLIRLKKQVDSAIKIEEASKAQFEGDDVAHPAFQYHLGRLHSLNEFREKLNDLIIQG